MVSFKMKRHIFVPRLLELSNDVEKNPGPPKVIKSGLIPAAANGNGHKDKTSNKMADKAEAKNSSKDTNGTTATATTTAATKVDDGMSPTSANDLESLRAIVERQAEIIRLQRSELEAVKKQMEKNQQLSQDFQSEMSEIRKNWQTVFDAKKPAADDNSNQASIASKLEALASAYNDIQDRLYEIDKSWKNNLMIYGVPCAENIEEDTVITEEKVMELVVTCDIPRHANIGIHKTHMRSNMRIHRYSVNRVCIMYIVRIHVSRYLRRTW